MKAENYAEKLNRMDIDHPLAVKRLRNMLASGGEDGVLRWLDQRSRDTYAVDIIEHFGLTAGRVANIAKKLEERGYIKRVTDSDDQRRARIFLTEEGHQKAVELHRELNQRNEYIISRLGNSAESFMRSLDRMIEMAEKGEAPFDKE